MRILIFCHGIMSLRIYIKDKYIIENLSPLTLASIRGPVLKDYARLPRTMAAVNGVFFVSGGVKCAGGHAAFPGDHLRLRHII